MANGTGEIVFPPIFKSTYPPLDKEVIWLDLNTSEMKIYDSEQEAWGRVTIDVPNNIAINYSNNFLLMGG